MPLPPELPRTVAEASADLARVYAEGLTKRAFDPDAQRALTGAAIGSGIGALGGVGLGLMNKKRRSSLLAPGLTGALLGAGIGGGVGGWDWMKKQTQPPTDKINEGARRVEDVNYYNKSPVGKAVHDVANYDYGQLFGAFGPGPEVPDPNSPGAKATPEQLAADRNASGGTKAWNILKAPFVPDGQNTALGNLGGTTGGVVGALGGGLAAGGLRNIYDMHDHHMWNYISNQKKVAPEVRAKLVEAMKQKGTQSTYEFSRGKDPLAGLMRDARAKAYSPAGRFGRLGLSGAIGWGLANGGNWLGSQIGNAISGGQP